MSGFRLLLRISAIVALCAAQGAPLFAATPYQRPAGIAEADEPLIVAGYRALFTCSAHFFAGRSLHDIKSVELVDVSLPGYPDPVIDRERRLVTATDGTGDVRRIAAFRDTMGCTLLPPHWNIGDVARLPYVAYAPAPDLSGVDFPRGDRTDLPSTGIDPALSRLSPLIERAFDGASYSDRPGSVTVALIVVDDGRLVVERYRDGFGVHSGYRTWSTAKSISAALLGIAAGKNLLDLDAPVVIPEWEYPGDPRQAITHKHLLWMSSGLYSGGNNTRAVYFGGQDVITAVTTTALETNPGTRWQYANNDSLLLLRALRHRLGDDLAYLRFPYDELMHRIGMYHTRMEIDHRGNFVGSSQVYTTARDLARFGVLLADDGVWQGQRILPEDWVKFSRSAAPTRPPQRGESGYGAQFWLLDQYDGVPPGTFTTAGNKGQYVTVVPGRKLVIVRTGVNPNGIRWLQQEFVAALLAAVGPEL